MDLGHALLAATLAEENSSRRGVRKDVAPNRLATVSTSKEGTGAWVALDLIGLFLSQIPRFPWAGEAHTINTQTLNSATVSAELVYPYSLDGLYLLPCVLILTRID